MGGGRAAAVSRIWRSDRQPRSNGLSQAESTATAKSPRPYLTLSKAHKGGKGIMDWARGMKRNSAMRPRVRPKHDLERRCAENLRSCARSHRPHSY
ncbi:hypothetical protein DICVIV_11693 [Dictyocaulus viviparus]|uniref:Uncharacterized protein n=1 Tax=Dictyocaulus viviparus TaxID=29172 RepID=A0A0D8XCJ6_DICVI|nr:hypothetical protein DICVIV_11693 [Dictyocaulus viviparus]